MGGFDWRFVLLALAVWRTASLLAHEEGPLDVFVKIRQWCFVQSAHSDFFFSLNKGINCMWCNSVWFGMLYSLVIAHSFGEWWLYALASSAVAIALEEKFYGAE